MKAEKFEKKLKGLTQVEVLTGVVAVLNKLLMDKGIVSEAELQRYMSDWLKKYRSSKKT